MEGILIWQPVLRQPSRRSSNNPPVPGGAILIGPTECQFSFGFHSLWSPLKGSPLARLKSAKAWLTVRVLAWGRPKQDLQIPTAE